MCFGHGAEILMNTGYVPTEKFTENSGYHGSNDVMSLKLTNNPHEIKVVCEQKFYVKTCKSSKNHRFSKAKWIQAKNLSNDHMIGIKINQDSNFPLCSQSPFVKGFLFCYKNSFCDRDDLEPRKQALFNNVIAEYDFYRDYFDDFDGDSKIPEWIQFTKKDYIQKFLDGYEKCSYLFVKHQLTDSFVNALSLQRLYLKIGKITKISQYKKWFSVISITPKRSFIEGGYAWLSISKIQHVCGRTMYYIPFSTEYTVNNYATKNELTN